jgi:hypothetical protein
MEEEARTDRKGTKGFEGWCGDQESKQFAASSQHFAQRCADLEVAIASVTRALGASSDSELVAVLVTERAAMREELRELRMEQSNVLPFPAKRDATAAKEGSRGE